MTDDAKGAERRATTERWGELIVGRSEREVVELKMGRAEMRMRRKRQGRDDSGGDGRREQKR